MKPERRSQVLLAITQSKAKMYEYGLPESDHIRIPRDPASLLTLSIGMLGDVAASVASGQPNADPKRSADVRFSARYFDSYFESRLTHEHDPYLLLLASASYYLCDLPGSSLVLASRISPEQLALGAEGLEQLLFWLLRGEFKVPLQVRTSHYDRFIAQLSDAIVLFYETGVGREEIWRLTDDLRRRAYMTGTARELLLADTASAIARRRHDSASWYCLPRFTELPVETWRPALQKPTFMRELWPAQRLLGEQGVFRGRSAIVQMPTSAGKSRATEVIIRSAYLSNRASVAVVVAPFRALCHEIRESLVYSFQGEAVSVNELTDVLQADFNVEELLSQRSIVVVTPEKLVYVLRHQPELAKAIGVLIYDEGHQFDTGARGVTYELLLTSLKELVSTGVQNVLISAVISNGVEIGSWLNGEDANLVSGTHLLPTERNIAFASWPDQLGQLQFVSQEDPDQTRFFVPRVIQPIELQRQGKEKKARFFPSRGDGQSVALYLGLKLVRNGGVAIFCGRKATAAGLCEDLLDAYSRELPFDSPVKVSNADEVARVGALYERNLGKGAPATRAASIGVFTHHGNTPHGVRLAVEYAMKEGLGRFVICTSTLAQGVNLPLRYLIVTTTRQGRDPIKVRDFHNLIGRAGRSGMHTEGSVLFADPTVYDKRDRWSEFKALLQVKNSEPCASTLLEVLQPLSGDSGFQPPLRIDPLDLAQSYAADEDGRGAWVGQWAGTLARRGFSKDGLEAQLSRRRSTFAAIESFLLAHSEDISEVQVVALAQKTLAYHLATLGQRTQLIAVFKALAGNVAAKGLDATKRKVFGKMLYGVGEATSLEAWVTEHVDEMAACNTDEEMFAVIYKEIARHIRDTTFNKWLPEPTRQTFASGWIGGISFGTLHGNALVAGVRIGLGERPRYPTVEHAVEMGEGALGFDGALAVGGMAEVYTLQRPADEQGLAVLQRLQKRLRYGLPSESAVLLYEAGFADRALAVELGAIVGTQSTRKDAIWALRQHRSTVSSVLQQYPSYFVKVFKRLAG